MREEKQPGPRGARLIRKALREDLDAVEEIYSLVHSAEEAGLATIGWQRSIYPTRATAEASLERGDLFVLEEEGRILGTAIINQIQVDAYSQGDWRIEAEEGEVMVLHTLVISPAADGRGLGRAFVEYYESMAREQGCRALRIDTNAINRRARAMYGRLGYREASIVPCNFQGLGEVNLVLLEKPV